MILRLHPEPLDLQVAGNDLTDRRDPVTNGANHPSDSPGRPLITRLRYRHFHHYMLPPDCCSQCNY